MADPITVFVSKYALAGEIVTREVWENGDGWVVERGKYFNSFKVGRDAHLTADEAIAAAKEARAKKVASLKKQIAKLEKRDFAKEVTALSPVTREGK